MSTSFESDASYGDTSGGTVNLVTKAGTNTFHGSVNEFNQFSAINGKSRCFQLPQMATPATRQNQYGGVNLRPCLDSHDFNGRNKLFFLYALEGFKDRRVPNPNITTVPTVAERTGDFSALLGLGTQCIERFAPYGIDQLSQSTYNSYQLFDPA